MHPRLRNSRPVRIASFLGDLVAWIRSGFVAPSPHLIKQTVLLRNAVPMGTWVETGTYLGQTTSVLARTGARVYTIEPQPALHAQAVRTFASSPNVSALLGTSESVLPALLPDLRGDVNFWLDGHYSAGVTFRGALDTPIEHELRAISAHLKALGNVCIAIDDVRCFTEGAPRFPGYPPLEMLVDWASKHAFRWHIEHDIFFAKRSVSPLN